MQSAGPSCLQRLHGRVCSLPLPASGGCWPSLTCGYITALSASVATRSPPLPSAWNPPLPSFPKEHMWLHLGPTWTVQNHLPISRSLIIPLALKHKIHQFQGLISSEDILQPTTLGICIYPSVFKCHWLKTALRVLGASWLPWRGWEKLLRLKVACIEWEVLRGGQWDDSICYTIIFCYLDFWVNNFKLNN